MRPDVSVRCPVVLELIGVDGPRLSAGVELRFAGPDPYAVVLAFPTPPTGEVVWRFARGLLAQGLIEAVGEGDVRLRPLDAAPPTGAVEIELRSPGGRAVFHAPRADLRDFLARTQDLVAFGAEHEWLDLDHAAAMLLLAPTTRGSRARRESRRGGRRSV